MKNPGEILLRKWIRRLIKEALTQQDIDDVMQTAHLVHLGQKRRSDDSDYIMHPIAVKDITEEHYPGNKNAQLLAILHDTLEDADKVGNISRKEAQDMISASIHDRDALDQIMSALSVMTHDKSVSYPEYLEKLFKNPLAAIVKVSDLIHNLSHGPSERQIIKYRSALEQVPLPGYIARGQKDQLMKLLGQPNATTQTR